MSAVWNNVFYSGIHETLQFASLFNAKHPSDCDYSSYLSDRNVIFMVKFTRARVEWLREIAIRNLTYL